VLAVSRCSRETVATILFGEFMYSLVPFAMLIYWIFFVVEKVCDSSDDLFEGGVNDVPVSALVRLVEIDLPQALGASTAPPLEPGDNVIY
jgi:putative membrane protein